MAVGVDQPTWKELTSFEEAKVFCNKVSYPVLVRPSYVLSGAAMNTVYSEADLEAYLKQAAEVSREHPVVITKYIENAKEIESKFSRPASSPPVTKRNSCRAFGNHAEVAELGR